MSSTDRASAPGTVRTGGRTERNRRAVFAATLEELNQYGYNGMSTARIADRAGVHRTTVYRRWPDLGELVVEALLEDVSADIRMPDTGDIQSDMRTLLRAIAARIDTVEGRARIRSMVSDGARSPKIASIARAFYTTRFSSGEAVIQRAIDRGELRDDIPAMTIWETFVAPLYLRLLITHEPLDNSFLDAVIRLGLQGGQRSGRSSSKP